MLQWFHNGQDGVSNHQPHDCLLNLLFRRRSKKMSKLHVTGLCAGNSPVTGEFQEHGKCFHWMMSSCNNAMCRTLLKESTLVQVMAWCCQATNHYLSSLATSTISFAWCSHDMETLSLHYGPFVHRPFMRRIHWSMVPLTKGQKCRASMCFVIGLKKPLNDQLSETA